VTECDVNGHVNILPERGQQKLSPSSVKSHVGMSGWSTYGKGDLAC